MELLSRETCLLLLEALLASKARLLLAGESSRLRLLESWTLPREACRLSGDLLELLGVIPRLHGVLVALSPLCHRERSSMSSKSLSEVKRWRTRRSLRMNRASVSPAGTGRTAQAREVLRVREKVCKHIYTTHNQRRTGQ